MRKVKFIIDDEKFLREELKRQSPEMVENQIEDIVTDNAPFKAIFTLCSENGNYSDRYELTDFDGNKMNINSLNGYQRGLILSDCYSYFENRPYQNNADIPCGVIEIIEED